MQRRTFVVGALAATAASALTAACGGPEDWTPTQMRDARWLLPAEWRPHERTWMTFGPHEEVWGPLAAAARRDLAAVATTIARFEPVSLLVDPQHRSMARDMVGGNVEFVDAVTDDFWTRDTGPLFVFNDGRRGGVDFNFNGWGGKQKHANDAKVAAAVLEHAKTPVLRTQLVLEGGGIEVDGLGTALIAESCVLNDNRNPGWTKPRVAAELQRLLGVTKIVWLPGVAGADITDGHTDFYARFTAPGVVVAHRDDDEDSPDYDVTRRNIDVLRDASDATGRRLRVEVLSAPTKARRGFGGDDFAAGYVNFYVCNGAVVCSRFGDAAADETSRATLARLFPTRAIVQLDTDAIAAGGGGIHCVTQQQPAP